MLILISIDVQYSQKAVFSFEKRSPRHPYPLSLFGKPWIQIHNNNLFLSSFIFQFIKAK